eukprot:5758833-Prymnesium_polylepis.1
MGRPARAPPTAADPSVEACSRRAYTASGCEAKAPHHAAGAPASRARTARHREAQLAVRGEA